VVAPLNQLLTKGTVWFWKKQQRDAFQEAKLLLINSPALVHFNPNETTYLQCDASSYGLGVVLSHKLDGQDRPIAFASKTLTTAQKKYSQLDKEALAIIFGLSRFHQYLYGRKFVIITDHKPLLGLFGEKKSLPTHAAARIQRWAIILSAYNYSLQFRRTDLHSNCDGLSRLPMDSYFKDEPVVPVLFLQEVEDTAITAADIANQTSRDTLLSKVKECVLYGTWPSDASKRFTEFYKRKDELTVEQDCLVWGTRVIIPTSLQKAVKKELHEGHPGSNRMKSLARSYVWWPGMNQELESVSKSCPDCCRQRGDPNKAQLHPWEFPTTPWSRVHIDYAGPYQGNCYLVVVDAHSKWPEVIQTRCTTSTSTIVALREIFCRFGLPETIVSDNGTQFISEEFETFLKKNGMKHRCSAPYHPATNGQAERFVQVLKNHLNKVGTNRDALNRLLFAYRNTPHATTGVAPSQLMFKRKLRTRLELLKPSLEKTVAEKQEKSIEYGGRRNEAFIEGEDVWFRTYNRCGDRWAPGSLTSTNERNYEVQNNEGKTTRRHMDQLVHRQPVTLVDWQPTVSVPEQIDQQTPAFINPRSPVTTQTEVQTRITTKSPPPIVSTSPNQDTMATHQPTQQRRYPERVHVQPNRLTFGKKV
jgi:transposase InsO family protein